MLRYHKNLTLTLSYFHSYTTKYHYIITKLTLQNIIFHKKSANNLADSKIMHTFALAKLTQLVP